MTILRHKSFQLMLAVTLMALPALAQRDSVPNSDLQTDSPPAPSAHDNSAPPPAAEGNWLDLRSVVLTLGDRGNTWIDDLAGRGLLFGVSSSQGYGWTRGPAFDSSAGALSVMQPYLGFFEAGHQTKILFQYAPTIDVYDGREWGGGVFQRASLDGRRILTRHLTWNFSGLTTYGKESLRQLAGLALTPGEGGTPGFLTFGSPLSSSVLVASGSTGLSWARTTRQEFAFTVGNSYGSSDTSDHEAVSARAEMVNKLGRQATWDAYTQVHDYLSQKGCIAYGAGVGISSALGQRTTVGVEGGPQFGNTGCGNRLSAAFAGFLQTRLSTRLDAYLTARRELIAPYLVGDRWADTFSARLKEQTSQTTFVDAGASYVRSNSVGPTPSYAAFLLSSAFHWRATNTFSIVGSYRYFLRNAAFASPNDRHNWVFLTLQWQPTSRSSQRQ